MRSKTVSMLAVLLIMVVAACGVKEQLQHLMPHSIAGTVTSSGSALEGVIMTLSGASTATATTDASGNYSFSGLEDGNYTVTPSKTGYTFNPLNSAQSISGSDVSAVNFSATIISTAVNHAPTATGVSFPVYAGTSPAFTPWVQLSLQL